MQINRLLAILLLLSITILTGNCNNNIKESTTITTINNKKIQINKLAKGLIFRNFKNKIVILEIYGDTCPYCIAAIPEYNELQKKYRGNIQILTVESYGKLNRKALHQFAVKHNMQFPTIAKKDSGKLLKYIKDLTGYSSERYGVPAIFIFNKKGLLIKGIPPQAFNKSQLEKIIQKLINE